MFRNKILFNGQNIFKLSIGELRELLGHLDADVHRFHLLRPARVCLRVQLPQEERETEGGGHREGHGLRPAELVPLLQLHLLALHPHHRVNHAITLALPPSNDKSMRIDTGEGDERQCDQMAI